MAKTDDAATPELRYDAAPFVPEGNADLAALRAAAATCHGCPLHHDTTGVVFGEGPSTARVLLVGEQPGDVEDRRGKPFVGPAGRVLEECVRSAGLDAADLYLTNAVKHFKHKREGKRRIHQRPTTEEVEACHPWLAAELDRVHPAVIVALGATAARAVLGKATPIGASHLRLLHSPPDEIATFVTFHPSAALRRQEESAEVKAAIVATLKAAVAHAADATD